MSATADLLDFACADHRLLAQVRAATVGFVADTLMTGYAPDAAALVEKFGGRYLISAPVTAQLEGEGGAGASVVVSEWSDKAAALAFWNSPEYAQAKALREGLAEVSVLLVQAPTTR